MDLNLNSNASGVIWSRTWAVPKSCIIHAISQVLICAEAVKGMLEQCKTMKDISKIFEVSNICIESHITAILCFGCSFLQVVAFHWEENLPHSFLFWGVNNSFPNLPITSDSVNITELHCFRCKWKPTDLNQPWLSESGHINSKVREVD